MNMKKFNINTIFKFDIDVMEKMNIDPIQPIDSIDEMWKFVKLDRHKQFNKERKYLVSNYGRIYSVNKRKILKNSNRGVVSSNGYNYKSVSLTYGKIESNYFVHRLVALAFIPIDKERPFVNHKDGCPEHNYLWNLEWVNTSENMIHAVKLGLKKDKQGENRYNALWTDEEIHFICSMIEDGHKATYIYHTLGEILKDPKVQYERVRSLYKHIIHKTHWRHISKNYNIDFSAFNYSKEMTSVKNAKNRKKKS